MTQDSNVDYKNAVGNFVSAITENKLNEGGQELCASILNGINQEILGAFQGKLVKDSDESGFLRSAHETVEEIFEGELQEAAIANAQRDLMLFETGLLSIEPGVSQPSATEGKSESKSTDETVASAAKKKVAKGVKDILSAKGLRVDKQGGEFANTRIANLLDFAAREAAANTEEGREVTAMDVKRVLDKYLTGGLLEAANDEGCRCVMLHQSGLIKFKPKKSPKPGPVKRKRASTTGAKTPSKKKATKPTGIVTPKPGAVKRKRASTTRDKTPSKKKTTKPTGKVTTKPGPVKRKRASTTRAKTPSKKKTSKATGKGTLKPEPVKRKRASTTSKTHSKKKTKPAGKVSPKPRPVKRKRPPTSSESKRETEQETQQKEETEQLDFSRGIKEICKTFTSHNVSINREGLKKINEKLRDICNKLIAQSTEAARGADELTAEHVQKAIEDLFPEVLAQHAIANGHAKPLSNKKTGE